ncbi:unnamed protein product [Ilex paraguariensis]|uniref:Uncharacterized protein n=1 Tax=Ilex paraguariensis TaxID=185542 RepID=A0ABC8QWX8_9AQUA
MNAQRKHLHGNVMLLVVMGMMGLSIIGYIVVSSSVRHTYCPPCVCDCSSQSLLSFPKGFNHSFFTDCTKHDPEVNEEMEKSITDLLSEELKLTEAEAQKNHRRVDMAFLEAKQMASQYQKEANKCNSGMETCEEAREKAEAALAAQKELTAMWQQRAQQKGWREDPLRSRVKPTKGTTMTTHT